MTTPYVSTHRLLICLSTALFLAVNASRLSAAAGPATEPAASVPPATQKLNNTVGVDIVKHAKNADGTMSLTFRWKDRDGREVERSVVLTDKTIIGIDGELKTLADVTDEQMRKKAVATVGDDGVTTIYLRIGRKRVTAPPDVVAAATPATTPEAAAALAKSNATVDKRAAGVIESLNLNDPAKAARVQAVIASDLRAVRDAHNLGFVPDPSVHRDFVNGLSAELTPEQVDAVKDKLTLNKVPITFKAYHEIVPNLTAEDDAKIMELLKAAREAGLDDKSIEELNATFKMYKLQIQKYLDAHGHDWAKSYKEYVDAHRGAAADQ
jgi:hypothetical protein